MGGRNDSSKWRVQPVFSYLERENPLGWVRTLLGLAAFGGAGLGERESLARLDLDSPRVDFADATRVSEGRPNRRERSFAPSRKLLEWLIVNPKSRVPKRLSMDPAVASKRQRLIASSDGEAEREALNDFRKGGAAAEWCTFEGPTYPDVVIETREALIVVEGKFTEPGPTKHSTWMKVRHQMLRHLDGAFESRGERQRLFGLLIVEGELPDERVVPRVWSRAAEATRSSEAVRESLPHRPDEERREIRDAFLGVVTWQRIVQEFGLPPDLLRKRI
jgi:hypothetical protein